MIDENKAKLLFWNYVVAIESYLGQKFGSPKPEPSQEELMRKLEAYVGIPESEADDFRRNFLGFIVQLGQKYGSENVKWDSSPPKLKGGIIDYIRCNPDESFPEFFKRRKYRSIDEV